MAEQVKFTDEEVKNLQELQAKYSQATADFGRIKVQKILLESEMEFLSNKESELEVFYRSLQKTESETVKALSTKYGDGQLDLSNGVFIPNPSK
jgi:predicted nuclease with TOPRIM domain